MSKAFKFYISFIFFLLNHLSFAQDLEPISELQELIIEANKVSNRSKSQHITVFNDSVLNTKVGTFTDFLQKNSNIYFKENGAGMVSSPSFRGTTAQQTSVLWNGIKVNSNLLGQSDFNATSFKNYDEIAIKAGGGSVLYGSGAIGGTIHLNNTFLYNTPLQNTVQLSYGSFNTLATHYKLTYGTSNLVINAHIGYNKSANDYEWQLQKRKNINGAYYNFDLGTEIAYKINDKHTLEYFSSAYSDDRYFALITPYQTKTKYQNENYRNLIKWHYYKKNLLNSFYISNIQEKYRYFDQLPNENNSGGTSNMWLLKNETFYQTTNRLKLGSLVEYQFTNALGTNSNLPKSSQEIASIALQAYYNLNNQGFEIGLKNEYAKDYANPFLFSIGYYFHAKNYQLKVNGSKNYRIPTFNDLYWQPGGNLELRAETSYQLDINHNIKLKNLNFNIDAYYISIEDMLRWVPTNTGLWEATNTNNVTIKGLEFAINYEKKWQQHHLNINSSFAYTIATNKNSNNQLTYSPKIKANGGLTYSFKSIVIAPSVSYTGKVFTTESNSESSALAGYALFDLYLSKRCFKNWFPLTVSAQIKNLTNKMYYSMPEREMPGINYHISLTKFF